MGARRVAVVGVVVAVAVSLLGGCGLFEDDVQTQLDKIVAEIGTENVVAVDMHATQKNVHNDKGAVGVTWIRDGRMVLTWVNEGNLVTEESGWSSLTGSPTNINRFSVDQILELAKNLINGDTCTSASVTSITTPAGSVGTWAECTGEGDGRPHVVDERSLLDGESFFVPRVDPQVAADLDVLKQAYVTVMGTSKIHRFGYYFRNTEFSLDGPMATNAVGETCAPTMTARFSSSSTPFPVLCDTEERVGDNPFDLNEFSSELIAGVVASVENSQVLDSDALGSITFYHHGQELCWKTTTDNIGDLSAHRDLLEGCTTRT